MTNAHYPNENDAEQYEEKPADSPLLRLPNQSFQAVGKFKQALAAIWRPIKNRTSRILSWFSDKFKDLTFSQWCYFIAAAMLLSFLTETQEDDDYLLVVGIVAGFGLLRELWQIFMRIWEHTFGKGVLFVLYASTANIALAVSALKINAISGIEPQTFVFTMGFTTMLMLPFWILLASVIFLGSAIVLLSLWSFLSFLLRLFRIRLKTLWQDKSFALLTMWMRIIFIPCLIYVMWQFLEPYMEQLDVFDDTPIFDAQAIAQMPEDEFISLANKLKNSGEQPLSIEDEATLNELGISRAQRMMLRNMSNEDLNKLVETIKSGQLDNLLESSPEQAIPQTKTLFPGVTVTTSENQQDTEEKSLTEAATEATESTEVASEETEEKDSEEKNTRTLDKLIAGFIYQFEAYRFSACRKAANQRVLTIDENTIFVIERDNSQELGYKFSVAPCIPAWSDE